MSIHVFNGQASGIPEPGAVCAYWRILAALAFAPPNACDYVILLGDDVELLDSGWQGAAVHAFTEISKDVFSEALARGSFETVTQRMHGQRACAPGFGIVALRDKSFPGFPSFPIIPRMHAYILGGLQVPGDSSQPACTVLHTSSSEGEHAPANSSASGEPPTVNSPTHGGVSTTYKSENAVFVWEDVSAASVKSNRLEIFPDVFKNQDADPFLFALYRRFGGARYLHTHSLRNTIGGASSPRYSP